MRLNQHLLELQVHHFLAMNHTSESRKMASPSNYMQESCDSSSSYFLISGEDFLLLTCKRQQCYKKVAGNHHFNQDNNFLQHEQRKLPPACPCVLVSRCQIFAIFNDVFQEPFACIFHLTCGIPCAGIFLYDKMFLLRIEKLPFTSNET